MSRPETIEDIELEPISFAQVEVPLISEDAALLKGYAAFLEAVAKAGGQVELKYNTAHLTREPSWREAEDQLKRAQISWDEGRKFYNIYASVGRCEYAWEETQARNWAEAEGMAWPPPVEPISSLDEVLDRISDEVDA